MNNSHKDEQKRLKGPTLYVALGIRYEFSKLVGLKNLFIGTSFLRPHTKLVLSTFFVHFHVKECNF